MDNREKLLRNSAVVLVSKLEARDLRKQANKLNAALEGDAETLRELADIAVETLYGSVNHTVYAEAGNVFIGRVAYTPAYAAAKEAELHRAIVAASNFRRRTAATLRPEAIS